MRLLLRKVNRVGGGYTFLADLCAENPDDQMALGGAFLLLKGHAPEEARVSFGNGVLEFDLTPDQMSDVSPEL